MKISHIIAILFLFLPFSVDAITKTEYVVLREINEARVNRGVPPVVRHNALEKSAYLKGSYMKKYRFFSHDWNGLSWLWWIRKSWQGSAGENLSYAIKPKKVVGRWLNSPDHRRILLDEDFIYIGIRAVIIDSPPLNIPGPNNLLIVTHYGY